MKKKICIGLMIFIVLLIFIPIPIKMNRTIPAIELLNSDDTYVEERTITIKGTYYWKVIKLFGQDVFQGNIVIDAYPVTSEKTIKKMKLKYNESIWLYYQNTKDMHDVISFGQINTRWLFRHFVIFLSDQQKDEKTMNDQKSSYSTDSVYTMIPYATSREEALRELQNVKLDFKWGNEQ